MKDTKEFVKESYAKKLEKAKEGNTSCCSNSVPEESSENLSSCCSSTPILSKEKPELVIPSFGSTLDLADKADLNEGDIVVDFGSGPGHDPFAAAKIIGKSGKAIGIDMTQEMIDHATAHAKKLDLDNVEVKYGEIENVPIEANYADVVISNCVINLSTDKYAVFKEAFRILKPGGRLVDSDKIANKELPESLRKNPEAWCGCIGGALTKEGYIDAIQKAGFVDIQVDIEQSNKIKWQGEDIIIHSGIIRAKKPN